MEGVCWHLREEGDYHRLVIPLSVEADAPKTSSKEGRNLSTLGARLTGGSQNRPLKVYCADRKGLKLNAPHRSPARKVGGGV